MLILTTASWYRIVCAVALAFGSLGALDAIVCGAQLQQDGLLFVFDI